MKSLKAATADLAKATADYQAEMQDIFTKAELEIAARQYQREVAALEAQAAEKPKKPAKKARESFKGASGKSPNGFLLSAVTGQLDAAIMGFHASNGRYPNEDEAKAIMKLINEFSEKPLPDGRAYEHMQYWQGHKKGDKLLYQAN